MRSGAEYAMAVLKSVRPESSEISSDFGQRGDAAYLRMWKVTQPERWAVVSSPGDRWFSLDVDGGFSLDYFEEDTPNDEVSRLLHRYVDLALQYLRDGATPYRTGKLGFPSLKMSTYEGAVVLRRSLVTNLKSLPGLGSRS